MKVFMVHGIHTNLENKIGYHASRGFTGDQLFPLVWEATRILEVVGFKVRGWVCDRARPNRAFFRINGVLNQFEIRYFTINRYSPDRNIYFISDIPHLLKATSTNLENSHEYMNTRNLHLSSVYWG